MKAEGKTGGNRRILCKTLIQSSWIYKGQNTDHVGITSLLQAMQNTGLHPTILISICSTSSRRLYSLHFTHSFNMNISTISKVLSWSISHLGNTNFLGNTVIPVLIKLKYQTHSKHMENVKWIILLYVWRSWENDRKDLKNFELTVRWYELPYLKISTNNPGQHKITQKICVHTTWLDIAHRNALHWYSGLSLQYGDHVHLIYFSFIYNF